MTSLSPQAQAVLDAAFTLADNLDRDVTEAEMIAAALRAAADQLFPEPDYWTKDNMSEQGLRLLRLKRDQLLAIAAELESND
jgi:hypothetical protein